MHLHTWQEWAGFLIACSLCFFVVAAFVIGLTRAAAKPEPAQPHPTNDELADMIMDAQSDMQRDKKLREQAELEQFMGGEL